MNIPSRFPFFRLLWCCGACLLLAACARQPHLPPLSSEQLAELTTQYTRREECVTTESSWRINLALRAGEEQNGQTNSRRVTALMWGNDAQHGPVRLDVMAGIGATIANAREDDHELILFLPRENSAVLCSGEDSRRALQALGVPLPLDLKGMASLLLGHFNTLFIPDWKQAGRLPDGLIQVPLVQTPDTLSGFLLLDEQARPIGWEDPSSGWRMELRYAATPDQPDRLMAHHREGQFAIVIVKTRETSQEFYSDTQLELRIPRGTAWRTLAPKHAENGITE